MMLVFVWSGVVPLVVVVMKEVKLVFVWSWLRVVPLVVVVRPVW